MIPVSENQVIYSGNGVNTAFSYSFKIIESTDLHLIRVAADGTETEVTSDYYVDMAASKVYYPGYAPGVEEAEADQPQVLQTGEKLVVYRNVPITQQDDMPDQWPFDVIESALDKSCIIDQQLKGDIDRALKFSRAVGSNFNPTFPIVAGKTIRIKNDGSGFETTDDPAVVRTEVVALKNETVTAKNAAEAAQANAEAAASTAAATAATTAVTNVQSQLAQNLADTNAAKTAAQTASSSAQSALSSAQNAASLAEAKAGIATTQAGIAIQKASDISASTAQIETNRQDILNINGVDITKKRVGVTQNANEQQYIYPNLIDFGEPNEPPMLDNIPYKGVNIIAHWYNDFGLKKTALAASQAQGNYKWYDWSWNFSTKATYDRSRHPILGWYQGDDRKTLDWILYWLGKAGVNTICPTFTKGYDMSSWSNASSPYYWMYVLLNQCKNIKNFKIMPFMYTAFSSGGGTSDTYATGKTNLISFITQYKEQIATYKYQGKRYALVYGWEGNAIRLVLDSSGTTNTKAYLADIASQVVALGFDGVAFVFRNIGSTMNFGYSEIASNYIVFQGDYANDVSSFTNYADYANADITTHFENVPVVPNVITTGVSSVEHTSTFAMAGSTPQLFAKRLNRTIEAIEKANIPHLLTIYNVSEWAEGGAGLIPNMQDGFGYLDAIAGCNILQNDEIDVDKVKTDTFNNVFALSHNLIATKVALTQLPKSGTSKTIEFTNINTAQLFNYTYNANDYVFMVSFQGTENLYGASVRANPAFGSKRMYAVIDGGSNTSDITLSATYVNLIIVKKNLA